MDLILQCESPPVLIKLSNTNIQLHKQVSIALINDRSVLLAECKKPIRWLASTRSSSSSQTSPRIPHSRTKQTSEGPQWDVVHHWPATRYHRSWIRPHLPIVWWIPSKANPRTPVQVWSSGPNSTSKRTMLGTMRNHDQSMLFANSTAQNMQQQRWMLDKAIHWTSNNLRLRICTFCTTGRWAN